MKKIIPVSEFDLIEMFNFKRLQKILNKENLVNKCKFTWKYNRYALLSTVLLLFISPSSFYAMVHDFNLTLVIYKIIFISSAIGLVFSISKIILFKVKKYGVTKSVKNKTLKLQYEYLKPNQITDEMIRTGFKYFYYAYPNWFKNHDKAIITSNSPHIPMDREWVVGEFYLIGMKNNK